MIHRMTLATMALALLLPLPLSLTGSDKPLQPEEVRAKPEEDKAEEVQTYEGRIGGIEVNHITLLTDQGPVRFEVFELTAIDLDGTPVMLDRLIKASFAKIESAERSGVKVAKKISARSTEPNPNQIASRL